MKNKTFNLRNEYKTSWRYILESKKFIYAIIFIFFFFTLIGFLFPAPSFLSNYILDYLKNLLEQTNGFNQIHWIGFIFFNNLQSSFFGMIFGIIFGVLPFVEALVNGYLLGFVSSISVKEQGFFVLWKILPHGVFELPAIFISLGLGLRLGTFIFQEKKKKHFKELLFNSFRVFFYIVIPLLFIAAIIEGTLIFFAG